MTGFAYGMIVQTDTDVLWVAGNVDHLPQVSGNRRFNYVLNSGPVSQFIAGMLLLMVSVFVRRLVVTKEAPHERPGHMVNIDNISPWPFTRIDYPRQVVGVYSTHLQSLSLSHQKLLKVRVALHEAPIGG